MDTQHAQQLTELLEVVRTTMQEQVVFNVETVRVILSGQRFVYSISLSQYLDDLCRRLVPEISQLLKEVKDKADEKNKLNRRVTCIFNPNGFI